MTGLDLGHAVKSETENLKMDCYKYAGVVLPGHILISSSTQTDTVTESEKQQTLINRTSSIINRTSSISTAKSSIQFAQHLQNTKANISNFATSSIASHPFEH